MWPLTDFIYSIVENSKSRKHANFVYATKFFFALKGINGVESKWLAAKSQ